MLGGLDVERAMKGQPALKPGLVSQAHGGVLYIDEVNLLPDHLADALLDAVASGVHVLEREGFSAVQDARFVLVGSMNLEEGALRPQLRDRFALSVDVIAPADPIARRLVVERRLRFDADPAACASEWSREEQDAAVRIAIAKTKSAGVGCPTELLDYIANAVCERNVRSLRADLSAVRAGRALAALEGTPTVTRSQVDAVLPLVLGHRAAATQPPARHSPTTSQPPRPRPDEPGDGVKNEPAADQDRIFAPVEMRGPQLVASARSVSGFIEGENGIRRGVVVHARASESPSETDARATIVHALARTGSAPPAVEDLHERVRAPVGARRYLFVVDASGSHAVQQRMRFVKGAILAMLDQSARRQDEMALIAFRGTSANLVLPPTRSRDDAAAVLAYLPTGGRTPLAHGLELAVRYITASTTMILLTDGHANVPSHSGDAWADALGAMSAVTCPVLVVDSEAGPNPTGRARQLAEVLGAVHVRLDDVNEMSALRLVRER